MHVEEVCIFVSIHDECRLNLGCQCNSQIANFMFIHAVESDAPSGRACKRLQPRGKVVAEPTAEAVELLRIAFNTAKSD